MYRSLVTRFVTRVAIVTFFAAPAAAQGFNVPRPPAQLSPDLTEPWIVQLAPSRKATVTYPRQTRPVQVQPMPQPVYQQQQVRIWPLKPTPYRQQQPSTYRVPPAGGDGYRPLTPSQAGPLDERFLPRMVKYTGKEKPGTIIIDTNQRFLYLVQANGSAMRYGVGVGRPGFEWAGVHSVTRKAEWPDWRPPAEMLQRRPDLPKFMPGGPTNPLGARALYLGSTLYRIHGSNEPWTIGQAVSSGCIRMRNEDVTDLYNRVGVGTRVIVI